MDYTWGVPVPQSVMASGYHQYQQYPQTFSGYEPYYMGYPWTMSSYASMYPYMAGYHQMPNPTNVECEYEPQPPPTKRARIDPKIELPNLRDIDDDLSKISTDDETSGSEGCPSPDLTQDISLGGPMTSTLANPLPPLTVDTNDTDASPGVSPPVSPIPHVNTSSSPMNDTYSVSEHQPVNSPLSPHMVDSSYSVNEQHPVSFPVQQHYFQEQPIAPEPFQGSQVMVVLPDGTTSSLWDQQVPAAFAAYQQPAPYQVNNIGVPGPIRRRRGSRVQGGSRPKNYNCNLCDKSYESNHKLKLHMNTHTGERPFVCEFCGKGFARGPNLNAHRRVHTGEKPFGCKRCGRGFSHPTDRIIHLVTEVCIRADRYIRRTGQGWECVSCDSGDFESRDQAERHARQHETGKGLSCPVCSTNYQGQKAHVLVKHVKDCHPEYMDSIKN